MSEIYDIEEIPEGSYLIILKLIAKYKWSQPIIMAKYEDGMYHKGSFHGGSNSYINLIMYEDRIVNPSKLQSYVLHWYHMYLLHPLTYQS